MFPALSCAPAAVESERSCSPAEAAAFLKAFQKAHQQELSAVPTTQQHLEQVKDALKAATPKQQ